MDEAIKKLVDIFIKEYVDMKADLNYYKNANDHLTNLNETLRCSERDNAEALARLKELVLPAITWSEARPLSLTLFRGESLRELCKILKIKPQDKSCK